MTIFGLTLDPIGQVDDLSLYFGMNDEFNLDVIEGPSSFDVWFRWNDGEWWQSRFGTGADQAAAVDYLYNTAMSQADRDRLGPV